MTLDYLARSDAPADCIWDILVVNNACTDDTSQVVTSFAGRLPVRETYERRSGLSAARNRALVETTGSHIAFIDDDVHVHRGWLRTLRRLATTYPDCAVLSGPVHPYFPIDPDPDLVAAFPYLKKGFCALDYGLPEGPLRERLLPAGANRRFVERLSKDSSLHCISVDRTTLSRDTTMWTSCVVSTHTEEQPFGHHTCRWTTG